MITRSSSSFLQWLRKSLEVVSLHGLPDFILLAVTEEPVALLLPSSSHLAVRLRCPYPATRRLWSLLLHSYKMPKEIPGGWCERHSRRVTAGTWANCLEANLRNLPHLSLGLYSVAGHRAVLPALYFIKLLGISFLSNTLPPETWALVSGCDEGRKEIWAA